MIHDLADRADDPGIRTLFASLAGEEVRHWQSLQRQYEVLVAG